MYIKSSFMTRAAGFCLRPSCTEYARCIFLVCQEKSFHCPECHQKGHIETERGFSTGNSPLLKEVRVEYGYDPVMGRYRNVAIVRDENLVGDHRVFTLFSPTVQSEKRALKVAEAALGNLSRCPEAVSDEGVPQSHEFLLSFGHSLARAVD